MIAFYGAVAIIILNDDAEGTNHDAGPAGHAPILIVPDFSRLRMPGNAARYARLGAEGFLAMPALQRDRSNSLRRGFIEYKLMQRESGGGQYWLTE